MSYAIVNEISRWAGGPSVEMDRAAQAVSLRHLAAM